MVKRIFIFFLIVQVLVIIGVVWAFSASSNGKLNWAQEVWRRMHDDQRQHCFDVVKESQAYGMAPSVRLLDGQLEKDKVLVHYRILQQDGCFQEYVHECALVNGVVDKVKERRQVLNSSFSDVSTQLR